MSDDETERLVAEIDARLKARTKADPRTIREVVERALEHEFATGETAAIERRIDEKKQRIQTLEREINERERELAAERDELARLESQLDEFETERELQLEAARDALENTPRHPDNPAVKNWADDLGMTPTQLLEVLDT
jgi:septal ring factor EnvC (AmiA/AmiB activator)